MMFEKGRARAWVGIAALDEMSDGLGMGIGYVTCVGENAPSRGEGRARPGLEAGRWVCGQGRAKAAVTHV